MCQRMRGIDPTMPSSNFRMDTQNIERCQASLLIQLRTSHIPPQAHLHRIGKADSPVCHKCCKADKAVHLTTCPAFAIQRGHMESHLRRASKSISTLLTSPNSFPQLFKVLHD